MMPRGSCHIFSRWFLTIFCSLQSEIHLLLLRFYVCKYSILFALQPFMFGGI